MSTPIPPVRAHIAAPRELVFEMAAAVGGSLPDGPPHASELVSRNGDVLIVRFSAPAPFRFFGFVEEVTLSPPTRIDYRVLKGPLDHVEESLEFHEDAGMTTVIYGGVVGHRIPLVARFVAVPAYRWYMTRTLAALKKAAERRASRSRRYPAAAPRDG
ncbi:MAG: SRPBCC family protein [Candidatus Limnocylindria bacterium]